VARVAVAELPHQRSLVLAHGRRRVGVAPAQQHGAQALPQRVQARVILRQRGHRLAHARIGVIAQPREQVALLVLVVVRAGEVEVAQHVTAGAARGRVMPLALDMPDDAREQPQAALHALVAGFEHLERLLEAHGRAAETGQLDG